MEQFKQTSRTEQLVARYFPVSLALLADDRAIVVVAKRTGCLALVDVRADNTQSRIFLTILRAGHGWSCLSLALSTPLQDTIGNFDLEPKYENATCRLLFSCAPSTAFGQRAGQSRSGVRPTRFLIDACCP